MADNERWICTNCGYTSLKRFDDDICPHCRLTYWQCLECGYTLKGRNHPEVCPQCMEKSYFINITSYIPDWNGPEYRVKSVPSNPHLS